MTAGIEFSQPQLVFGLFDDCRTIIQLGHPMAPLKPQQSTRRRRILPQNITSAQDPGPRGPGSGPGLSFICIIIPAPARKCNKPFVRYLRYSLGLLG